MSSPSGVPPGSRVSTSIGPSTSELPLRDSPMPSAWVRLRWNGWSNGAGRLNGPGLSQIVLETPSRPTSCSRPARLSSAAAGSPSPARSAADAARSAANFRFSNVSASDAKRQTVTYQRQPAVFDDHESQTIGQHHLARGGNSNRVWL